MNGRALAEVAPPGSFDSLASKIREVFATASASDAVEHTAAPLADPANARHWLITFYPVCVAPGEVALVGIVVVDITEHKRALLERAEALAREARTRWEADAQKAHLQQLFARAPMPICILRGPRLVIELANPPACEVMRRPHDEVIGRPLFEAVPEIGAQGFEELLEGVRATGRPYVGNEVEAIFRGDTTYFNFVYAPTRDIDGEVDGVLVLATDVTDAVEARRELARTLEYNERFTAILGHDLRNPLHAIMTNAQLVRRMGLGNATQPAVRILRSSERMLRMINQLLDLARVRGDGGMRLRPKRLDLAEVGRQVVDELRLAYPGSSLELVTDGDLVGRWDGDRLAQVLSNLGGNALQHGRPEAPVYVRLDGRDPARVDIRVENAGAIPEPVLPVLFDPFRMTHYQSPNPEGLGLGLYISKEIVDAHHGTIRVHSSATDGTCFQIELPKSADAAAPP
jgi:PAS domain S-box-containing protein